VLKLTKTTYIYWLIECTPKPYSFGVLKLTRITYIYWPIACTSKPWFEVFKVTKITYIYWLIDYTPKPSFGEVFEVTIITYIYWLIECTSKIYSFVMFRLAKITYILANCMHSKTFIWGGVWNYKNYLPLLANWL
jgi:hypothetical protein